MFYGQNLHMCHLNTVVTLTVKLQVKDQALEVQLTENCLKLTRVNCIDMM